MAHPLVIIELLEDELEGLHSNIPVSFVIVKRTDDGDITEVSGPYAPTRETHNLATVVDGVEIPTERLAIPATDPFFAICDEEILEPPDPNQDEN